MKSLNEDIKSGQFKSIYLLYGEERYLKRQYKQRMVKAMSPDEDDFNYSYFEGKGSVVSEIIGVSETLPFFSDYRLIVIEDSGFFKNVSGDFADYLKNLPETTRILFVESEIDKRNKLYKMVKDKGRIVEFGIQSEADLIRWIGNMFQKNEKSIDNRTAKHLIEQVGTDMERLSSEIEKLTCYAWDNQNITTSDIDQLCAPQIQNQIFQMVDAVAEKKQKRALEFYYDLIALKEPPLKILALLARQFRIMLEVKSVEGQGYGNQEIATKVGISPYFMKKYLQQTRSFSYQQLREILEEVVIMEHAIKSGYLNEKLGVELFIVKYSMA